MAEYWGLHQIAHRMGWGSLKTPLRQKRLNNFLMYRRRRGSSPRWLWYSNDGLIHAWEIALCQAQRDEMLHKEEKKSTAGGAFDGVGARKDQDTRG